MAKPGLLRHRKFIRLARALDVIAIGETQLRGFGNLLAAGTLELLWGSTYANGEEIVGTADDVEALVKWRGAPGVLFAALRDAGLPDRCGFIEERADRPGVWLVHDLLDHAPEYVATRLTRGDEQRKEKRCAVCAKEYHSTEHRSVYCSTACRSAAYRQRRLKAAPVVVVVVAPVVAPVPPPPDVAAEQATPPESLPTQPFFLAVPPIEPPPPVIVLPCSGKGPKEFAVTERMMQDWREAFPALDVLAEIRRAKIWVDATPSRRKTHGGMKRFLVSWFSRTQDRGGGGNEQVAPHRVIGDVPHLTESSDFEETPKWQRT